MRILLAADGSPFTRVAARHLVSHMHWFAHEPELHVVHVHAPLPYLGAAADKGGVDRFQREESEAALAVARKELLAAGIPYRSAWRVGDAAPELAAYVSDNSIDLVVMGSRGHGALAGLALGSVVTKCIATLTVPVMIVRQDPAAGPATMREQQPRAVVR